MINDVPVNIFCKKKIIFFPSFEGLSVSNKAYQDQPNAVVHATQVLQEDDESGSGRGFLDNS